MKTSLLPQILWVFSVLLRWIWTWNRNRGLPFNAYYSIKSLFASFFSFVLRLSIPVWDSGLPSWIFCYTMSSCLPISASNAAVRCSNCLLVEVALYWPPFSRFCFLYTMFLTRLSISNHLLTIVKPNIGQHTIQFIKHCSTVSVSGLLPCALGWYEGE